MRLSLQSGSMTRARLHAAEQPCTASHTIPGSFYISTPFLSALWEMAGRALKQTGSRSIEAALEYISKMGYLDPRNEQIVRVIKQTSPGERKVEQPQHSGYSPALCVREQHFGNGAVVNSASYNLADMVLKTKLALCSSLA
ncbi:hypothetical protein P7K49_012280 [Saguinus oedipus]|uniref:Uncharacterized protein n=1 Tax=Saguinus oedipus TaxID=9490 RepID=A0ABQ9VT27_SAGOE|nr:hypothetical protein P7K49_012280 [Saguinus oedipus]